MSEMSIEQARSLLGVPQDASAETLRRARRTLVRANHPDLLARHQRAAADRRLSDINTAFDILIRDASSRGPERDAEDFAPQGRAATPARTPPQRRPAPAAPATPAAPKAATTPPHPAEEPPAAPLPATRAPAAPPHSQHHHHRAARRDFDTTLDAVTRPLPQPTRTQYA